MNALQPSLHIPEPDEPFAPPASAGSLSPFSNSRAVGSDDAFGGVLPRIGPRLGIIGGGQLARLTAMAAQKLGCQVLVLQSTPDSPAESVATRSIVGNWKDLATLHEFASEVDVVTVENEFVNAPFLQVLENRGHSVLPTARTLALVQDKLMQKRILQSVGIPVPQMMEINTVQDLREAAHHLALPLVLKTRRDGYDGKGNVTVSSINALSEAWHRLGGNLGNGLYAEEFCTFQAELAVVITRNRRGEVATYPVAETVQRNHVCNMVRTPADFAPEILVRAVETARCAVEAVDAIGTFAVEMFLTPGGQILVNELAPRVHNSGHYSIEACVCSQFENHVRAVFGLPLGSTRMVAPAAVMINLLGTAETTARLQGLHRALAVPGAHVHIYGKSHSGLGRKMGHVTALGETLEAAEQIATLAAAQISFERIP